MPRGGDSSSGGSPVGVVSEHQVSPGSRGRGGASPASRGGASQASSSPVAAGGTPSRQQPRGPPAPWPARPGGRAAAATADFPRFPVSRQSSTTRSCGFADGGGSKGAEGQHRGVSRTQSSSGVSAGGGGGCCLSNGGQRGIPRTKMTTRCLWNACKALSIGLVLLALGCAMATLGYYADQLSEWRQSEGNTTVSIKDDWTGFHLNNLSYAGPIVMGVGGFIVVAACVMTFEARDSAAKVVPARFRLQRPRSPARARKGPHGATPAGILPHGAPGSRRSAASQTGDANGGAAVGPHHHQQPLTDAPPPQQPKRTLAAASDIVHHNHQQILELLARRRREDRLTSSFIKRPPGGAPPHSLKRTPSAPSALNRLHRPPPRPPDALLPPPPSTSGGVARTWSRKRSLRQSPLAAGGGRRKAPLLRRQALSVDQGTAAAAAGGSQGRQGPDFLPRLHARRDSEDEDEGQQQRRTATVVCHHRSHESYSPLLARDVERGALGAGPGGSHEGPLERMMSVEVVIEPLELAGQQEAACLLGAAGPPADDFTDLDVVRPYPESPPPNKARPPMLTHATRSETARRHLLSRQDKVAADDG